MDILDMASKNSDLLFLAFTNGTLIDKKTAERIAYLPMGRNVDFGLMPTPGQRLEFRELIWNIIEHKKLFLLDFWNHGTLVNGCIAAGRSGGYLHIHWNGNVMPCVFTPYSSGNIIDVYNSSGSLADIWNSPFLSSIRDWQKKQGHGRKNSGSKNAVLPPHGNLLTPCPYRDHYEQFIRLVKQHNGKPQDDSAAMMLKDLQYYKKMALYDKELEKLFAPLWQQKYSGK